MPCPRSGAEWVVRARPGDTELCLETGGGFQAGKTGKVEAVRPVIYSGNDFSLVGEKGRFVLPPKFRTLVIQSSGDRPVLYLSKHEKWNCLVGFGDSRRLEIKADLDLDKQIARDRREEFDYDTKAQLLLGGCEPVTIDGSGRFVVPTGLIKPGCVGSEMHFLGHITFFTLWNPVELNKLGDNFATAKSMCAALREEALAKARKK